MTHMIIDTDTASDDAVALLMALRHPDVTVEAITVVAGNVPVDQGVQNALYTAELAGAGGVPVYRGAERPLLVEQATAQHVHGKDGMGDLGLPLHGRTAAAGHAVDALIATAERHAGEVTLVALGPLTDLAIAVSREPRLAQWVTRCVVMGGTGDGRGNITPVAEFNVWADPHAAQMVMRSGLPLEIVGWDISRKHAVFDDAELDELRRLGPLAEFAVDINRTVSVFARTSSKLAGLDLPDPIAMAVALDPGVATRKAALPVQIDTADGLGRGQTVIDHTGLTARPANATVVFDASRAAFLNSLRQAVTR
ncbi:nucleoside hydrolase [Amycolatopsis sp. NPDC054798]